MYIYLLAANDTTPVDYDEIEAAVVAAPSELEARQFMTSLVRNGDPLIWMTPTLTTCEDIGSTPMCKYQVPTLVLLSTRNG